MNYDAILGRDALSAMDAKVTKDGVELQPRVKEEENHSEVLCANTFQITDVREITVHPTYKGEIEELIGNFHKKKKDNLINEEICPVELEIVPDGPIIPFRQTPSRLAFPEQQAVNEQVDEWIRSGIVRVSTSNFASRVVVVTKKDGLS